MDLVSQTASTGEFAFSSSVKADVWHPQMDPKSYEWWYFDALAHGGKEAIVIVFLDNFIYSPRYNDKTNAARRYPAVSFTYFREGKPMYRCINEYPEDEFFASREKPACRIGESSFSFQTESYGTGYAVTINAKLSGDRRIEASFEWLSIESDYAAESFCYAESSHCWNMVAPRSDVTGKMAIFDRRGRLTDERTFRGTGYHDHNLDNRWLAKTIRDWQWGRAHYSDATAVFYRYCELGEHTPSTKLLVIKNGELRERSAEYEEQNYVRDKFGIRYPTRLRLISEDNMRLRVKPIKVIDSSFYYLRFLSEITLTLRDGVPRKTTGITEFLAPKTLKYRWLNWLSDMRTGKTGKRPSYRELTQLDRGAVSKDFRRALSELGRVIAHPDHGVRVDLMCVTNHPVKGLHSGLFANDRKFFNISAGDRFYPADEPAPDPGRPDHDPANNTQVLADLASRDVISSCYYHAKSYNADRMEIPEPAHLGDRTGFVIKF